MINNARAGAGDDGESYFRKPRLERIEKFAIAEVT